MKYLRLDEPEDFRGAGQPGGTEGFSVPAFDHHHGPVNKLEVSRGKLEGPLGWYLKSAPECLAQVEEFGPVITEDPIQVLFGGPPSRIAPLEPVLRASAAMASIHLTWTKYPARNTSLLDVMNKGCSKGSALAVWAKRTGIEPSDVMAIGDNFNDLEMLAFAGRPVLMGNSDPALGRDGWPVTASNDEDGVARAIRTYVLGE